MDPALERDVVAGLRRGEARALEQAFHALRPRIFAFLLRMSRERALAEDLTQETFLRLAAAAPRLAPDTHLSPWLFTVARHLYFSHGRALGTARRTAAQLETATLRLVPSPLDAQLDHELGAALERAMGALPVASREVVLLVGVEGLTPAAAALVLGVSPETLRQRLSRARALLRHTLEQQEQDRPIPRPHRISR